MTTQPMIVAAADRLSDTQEYYFSRKLQDIAKMRAQGIEVINLGIGSPDMAPSPKVIDAATRALNDEKNHGYAAYRSSPALRRALSDWYKKTYQVTLDSEGEVLPLLGSKEGILYLSLAYLNPGDGVLVPDPGYPAYAAVAKLIGARVIYYDLKAENGWLPDFDQLNSLDLKNTKLMWINYPHMPTGASAPAGLFKSLVEFGQKRRILVCNDNPYGLVLNEKPPVSLLNFDPSKTVALELNSLSKSFNMAGWRVGMIAGSSNAIDAVLKVKSNVDSGMFTPVQAGAIEALSLPDSWHAERNQVYQQRRDQAAKIFTALGFDMEPNQVGLFLWARAPDSIKNVELFVDDFLAKSHVFLTPGHIFGSNGLRYARISLCANADTLKAACVRAEEYRLPKKGFPS